MKLLVNLKQLGSRRGSISGVPFVLELEPQTVAELIAGAVRCSVAAYNERFCRAAAEPLDEASIRAMSELGKIAFGLNHGERMAEVEPAIARAWQAYEDGLFRLFIGEQECGALGDAIELHERDCLSFIRLTLLTGGIC